MRKFSIFFILVILLSIIPRAGVNTMEKNIKDFKIEIIKYYFGRENIHFTIPPEKLIYETYITMNRQDHSLIKREITDKERGGFLEFLSVFPLTDLKENYYNKGVKDGTQIRFVIRIGEMEKNIFVANYYIKELGDLVAEVVKLLPEDHINYSPGSVSAIIEK